MSSLRVAVVGGGIGGLVHALALRERGIQAEVFFTRSSFLWLSPRNSHTPNGQFPA